MKNNRLAYLVYGPSGKAFFMNFGYYTSGNHLSFCEGDVFILMRDGNILVEIDESRTKSRILGWVGPDGKVVEPAIYAEIWTLGLKGNQVPRIKNPPPPPVTFDFGAIPRKRDDTIELTFDLDERRRRDAFHTEIEIDKDAALADAAELLRQRLTKAGLKADREGEVVRVHGWVKDDGTIRVAAAGGRVASPDLFRSQLPKVTGLPRPFPCVEFDVSPLAAAKGRKVLLDYAVGPGKNGNAVRNKLDLPKLPAPEEVADLMVDQLVTSGLQADRDGTIVRVYAWYTSPKMQRTPFEWGAVASEELKKEELPKITGPKKER